MCLFLLRLNPLLKEEKLCIKSQNYNYIIEIYLFILIYNKSQANFFLIFLSAYFKILCDLNLYGKLLFFSFLSNEIRMV